MTDSKKHGVQGWRQPSLPGVDAPLPAGATGLAIGTRAIAALKKQKQAFDNTKDVTAMVPYEEDRAELQEMLVQELAVRGEVGPAVSMAAIIGSQQFMWAQWFFAKAQESQDAKLAESASRLGDAANANVARAHELHTKLLALQAAKSTPRDVLDGFSDAPVEDLPPAPEENSE